MPQQKGSLYSETASLPPLERKNRTAFEKISKYFGRNFSSLGKGAKFTEDQKEAMDFVGYDVTPQEYYAAYKALFVFGLLAGIIVAGWLFLYDPFSLDYNIKLASAVILVIAPIGLSFYYLKYPSMAAERERKLSLAYIPEIINYLSMSMRLNPNLERAVQFAASHGRGKIAEDFKKVIWDVQLGKYASVEEGLDDLAYKWGNYSDDFKHSLMLIRASMLEGNKEKREMLLEKAGQDVLEGTREKMDLYARELHQPTVYLYYFGILLPLLLAIILPIGGSISKLSLARPEYLFVIYDVFLPIGIYFMGSGILKGRPPTYVPPEIPADYPYLPPKGKMRVFGILVDYRIIAITLFIGLLYAGYAADQVNKKVLDDLLARGLTDEASKIPRLTYFDQYGLYVGLFSIYGFLLAISCSISVMLLGKYYARKKVQDDIRRMEGEFKDAIYVLASRLGENRPIEDALRHSTKFLPKSRIANEVFRTILDNITTLGMTLDTAIFDPTFGALRHLPSSTIKSGMRILTDSVDLGVNVAAKSLINLSVQLRNSQKIDESLRRLLEDVTVMLRTMSTFIAPIVLAVVSSMQQLIIGALSSTPSVSSENIPGASSFGSFSSFFSKDIAKNSADPTVFTLIMGIYVIEVVALLNYFNSQIEDTNNPLNTYVSIATSLPIAVIIYVVAAYVTGSALVGAGG